MKKHVLWIILLMVAVVLCTGGGVYLIFFHRWPTPEVETISVEQSGPMEELAPAEFAPDDWPWWRGPTCDGIAAEQDVPVRWSETENIIWQAEVPGRGHASPTVVGDRIFLATADEEAKVQSVVCYDRSSGEQLWQTDVHRGNFERKVHKDATHAASTVACDGTRVFAAFLNDRKIWLTALDLEGEQLWQTDTGPFNSRFGYGASPAIHRSLVIVAGEHKDGGFLAAVHRKSGEIVWRIKRPEFDSYASPRIVHVDGRDQLLISGCEMLAGYSPDTGKMLWSAEGTAKLTVGTAAVHGDLVVASGGYPENQTLCVRADGSGEVVWKNNTKIYSTSILSREGHFFAVTDSGTLYCWEAETGKETWSGKLGGGFSASPTLAGGHVYLCSENGKTFVFKPNPEKYELVAENQLGDEIFASPTICGNRIYLRAAHYDEDQRREVLYCIGSP